MQNLNLVINSINLPKFRIHFNYVLMIIYFGTLLITISMNTELYARWLPLNGPLIYPLIPKFLFNTELYFFIKYFFVLACVFCSLSIYMRFSSILCFLSGFLFTLLNYSAGIGTHQFHLPILLLLLIATHFNLKLYFTQKQLLFACRLSFCLVFFTSGLSKLKLLGLSWLNSNLHISYLLKNRFFLSSQTQNLGFDLSHFVITNYDFFKWAFWLVLPLEILAIFALKPQFRFLIWFIFLFQVLASQIVFATFLAYLPLYAIWLDVQISTKFS